MKKYILSIAIFIVLLLASTIFLPYLFKDKIIDIIKQETNTHLKAQLDFNPKISINIFKSFPNLNLGFKDLSIIHSDSIFKNDTLFYANKLDMALDLMKFYRNQEYVVQSFSISKPQLNLELKNDTVNNWDIWSSKSSNGSSTFEFKIALFEIENGSFSYLDKDTKTVLKGIDHTSKGMFNLDSLILKSETEIEEFLVLYQNIAYVNKWKISQTGEILIDLKNEVYSLPNNDFKINGLSASLDGDIKYLGDDILFDVTINSKSSEINEFLTIIPAIYASDFESIKSKGAGKLALKYSGIYNSTSSPSYDLKLLLKNGWFKYPDFKIPAENINLNLHVYSLSGNADETVLDIPQLSFKLGDDPFKLKLNLKNIFSNPLIDASTAGILNLDAIKDILLLKKTKLSGKLKSSLSIKGSAKDISNSAIDKFYASGQIESEDFLYKTEAMNEELILKSALLNFKNQLVTIPYLKGNLGNNDLSISGYFKNFFSFVLNNETLNGKLFVQSNSFNTNDFITASTATDTSSLTLLEIPGNINLTLEPNFKKLVYDDLTFTDFNGNVNIANKALKLNNVSTKILGGKLNLDGVYQYHPTKPNSEFDISYSDIKVFELFNKFKLVQAFTPLAKEVNAISTAQLHFSSNLNQDMSPMLSNLNLLGSLNLEKINIKNIELLKAIDSKLGTNHLSVDQLNNLLLKFSIQDGNLIVEPFDLFIADSKLRLEGVSKIDGTINYKGHLSVPSAYVSSEIETINSLIKGTEFTNFSVKPNEHCDIKVSLGGTYEKPNVDLSLVDIKQEIITTVKSSINEEVERRKQEAEELAQKELDRIKEETNKKAQEAREKLRNELEKKKKEAEERLRKEAEAKKKELETTTNKKLKDLFKKK